MSQSNTSIYEPPDPKAIENQKKIGTRGEYADPTIAAAHVRRVARNIHCALTSPDTPARVKRHIKAYFAGLTRESYLLSPHAIEHVLLGALLHISRPSPFVPLPDYIEALTSGDNEASRAAMKEHDRIERENAKPSRKGKP
jgi:hypothetical protein